MVQKTPKVGIWFTATAITFFTRALMFSTWLSRGPEVKAALHLDTAQMGLLVMVYPLGGILGVLFASQLTNRFGTKKLTIAGYALACSAMAVLGFAVDGTNVWLAGAALLLLGLPLALIDFISNYEGTAVDKQSRHSLLPVVHAAFGVGMMVAAGLASALASAHQGIATNYLIVAVVAFVPSILAAFVFPNRDTAEQSPQVKKEHSKAVLRAWTEPRTLLIALVGFSFIMVESSAGTWMPISLTNGGATPAAAAAALGVFWVIVTAGRAIGGWVTDRIGRHRTIGLGALLTGTGIVIFMLDSVLHLPYLALGLWALGMANGFPLTISAMGDNPAKADARINMVMTVVYISVISVGPALGSVGQAFGLSIAYGIPLALMIATVLLSNVTKRTEASIAG